MHKYIFAYITRHTYCATYDLLMDREKKLANYFLCSGAPVSMSINGRTRGRLIEADDLENLITIQVPRSQEKRVEQKEGGVLRFLFQNGWKKRG